MKLSYYSIKSTDDAKRFRNKLKHSADNPSEIFRYVRNGNEEEVVKEK